MSTPQCLCTSADLGHCSYLCGEFYFRYGDAVQALEELNRLENIELMIFSNGELLVPDHLLLYYLVE